jgi:hypothetical protein
MEIGKQGGKFMTHIACDVHFNNSESHRKSCEINAQSHVYTELCHITCRFLSIMRDFVIIFWAVRR